MKFTASLIHLCVHLLASSSPFFCTQLDIETPGLAKTVQGHGITAMPTFIIYKGKARINGCSSRNPPCNEWQSAKLFGFDGKIVCCRRFHGIGSLLGIWFHFVSVLLFQHLWHKWIVNSLAGISEPESFAHWSKCAPTMKSAYSFWYLQPHLSQMELRWSTSWALSLSSCESLWHIIARDMMLLLDQLQGAICFDKSSPPAVPLCRRGADKCCGLNDMFEQVQVIGLLIEGLGRFWGTFSLAFLVLQKSCPQWVLFLRLWNLVFLLHSHLF